MSDGLTVGIIGCGKQSYKHAEGLRAAEANVSVRVFDVQGERALELANQKGATAVDSVDDLLCAPDVDAVIIATPTPTHFDLIMRALQEGKHVLCEKPLCHSLEAAATLKTTVRESGKFVQVGYVYRQVPAFKALHQFLTGPAPALGDPVFAIFRLGGRGSHSIWKHRKQSGGGVFNEMMVHMVDLALWFFGEFESITWHDHTLNRPTRVIDGETVDVDAEDFALATVVTKKGAKIVLQADLLTPSFRQYVEVSGTNGSFFGSIQSELPSILYLDQPVKDLAQGQTTLHFDNINLFDKQIADFLRHVRQGFLTDAPGVEDTIRLMNATGEINANV